MALYTFKMQRRCLEIQNAAHSQGQAVRNYIGKSFAALPYLIEEGYLTSRKEISDHIDMIEGTVDAWINNARGPRR